MGDEYMKQGFDRPGYDRDRRPFPGGPGGPGGDYCEPPRPEPIREVCCDPEPCQDDDWDWGSWLPILILIFFLCGGTNLLGGFGLGGLGGGFGGFGGGRDDCDDDGGGGFSWIIILVLVVFLISGNKDDRGGGFLGGLGGWF